MPVEEAPRENMNKKAKNKDLVDKTTTRMTG
jgi:hypothetical protein